MGLGEFKVASWGRRAVQALFRPIDIASLVYYRVIFGAIALWETWRYANAGWIAKYYIKPSFNFTYYGFSWVKPWPGDGMYWHFAALALLAVCIALGLFYRVATVLFFFGFTYVFLLEKAHYLNHLYLFSWVSLLMCFLPAHRDASLDARLRPSLRTETVPAWTLGALRFQMALVYVYAGIAKINGDWLRGWPLRDWLLDETDFPIIGGLFTETWFQVFFSYGGLLLDLVGPFFLMFKKTRLLAMPAFVFFHLSNARMFGIGIFPWFALATTLLFFPADWPRRIFNYPRRTLPPEEQPTPTTLGLRGRSVVALLGVFAAFHLLMPLRHHLYPGNVAWTEEGHMFSWRMKLRDKTGDATFYVVEPTTKRRTKVKTRLFLTARQERKMASRPHMVLEFAHHLADRYQHRGERPQVYADVQVSLNGRPYQAMIDPKVDLAAQQRSLWPQSWIVPLTTALPE